MWFSSLELQIHVRETRLSPREMGVGSRFTTPGSVESEIDEKYRYLHSSGRQETMSCSIDDSAFTPAK
jgi:hypothetical protein